MTAILPRSLLATLGLGLALGIAAAQDPASPVPPNSDPSSADSLGANPLSAIDPASLTGFRDRPLFSPTRTRPPDRIETEAAPEPEPAEAPPETVELQLLGVIGTPEGRSALVLDLGDDTRRSLREGETLKGWTVETLTATGMTLARDGEIRTFPLFRPTEPESTEPETSEPEGPEPDSSEPDDAPTDGAP